jgi:phosphomethylpyrimidine synthase
MITKEMNIHLSGFHENGRMRQKGTRQIKSLLQGYSLKKQECLFHYGVSMKTRIEYAQAGILTDEFRTLAQQEHLTTDRIMSRIASGQMVIMERDGRICGIGTGLRTKVNVNIGTSDAKACPEEEIKKAVIAEKYGADTLSELSMGGQVGDIRARIAAVTMLPLTTVPIYETAAKMGIQNMDEEAVIRTIADHADEGISSMVLHTVQSSHIEKIREAGRIMGVVSKGGSIVASYMNIHSADNPFISRFDEILDIFHEHDIVLSLGNTMRSGCIHDPRDPAQEEELADNIRLARKAREAGVQTIIEWSGGHVRADIIAENVRYYKERSEFPLFIAGPLPIDTAVGHDHIAGCVGASLASGHGADYLCYLTPSEHLGLPTPMQVREGLIAFRIAASIGDSMKYGPSQEDRNLARCRYDMDFEGQFRYAIDGQQARSIRGGTGPCTMCGDFCAIRLMNQIIR